MPHQCVRCNTFYEDGSEIILKGCPCGGRLFFYIKKEKLETAKKEIVDIKLTTQDKKQMEEDIRELLGDEHLSSTPVVLDLETIRVLKPGKYELDLVNLFRGEPLVFKLEEGKYMIDLASSFKKFQKKKKK